MGHAMTTVHSSKCSGTWRNTDLQKFYEVAEFDREHEEVKEIEERITSLVHEISDYIGRKDPLSKKCSVSKLNPLKNV